MTQYLLTVFQPTDGVLPEGDLEAIMRDVDKVDQDMKDAGVWVFGCGLQPREKVSVVATDGTVTDGPEPKAYIGGFSVVDVPSRGAALQWAEKFAAACRCAQEVRELGPGSRP